MRFGLKALLLFLIAPTVASCGDMSGPTTVENAWSGNIDRGDGIEIKGVNGDIIASPTSGNAVVVTFAKEGNTSDTADVSVEVLTHEDGVTVCAMYPDIPGEPPNVCGPGTDGQMNTRDNDVEVTFWVAIPEGVDFHAYVVNGSVTATDLESDVAAYTVNGNVEVSTSRHATAGSVNGSIDAAIGLTNLDYDLTYATVNGSVSVRVPAEINADVQLQTVHGNITADISLTTVSPGDVRGILGDGGHSLTLSSVNGSLRLDRGG